MVLGAGGAACAVVFALLERGVSRVEVANRSFERAMALRGRFGERVVPRRWEEVGARLGSVGLLVNATTLGMSGHDALTVAIDRLPAGAVVADLVYVPLETALIKAARHLGLRAVDGLGMLLHQAVGGFELWFGVRPQVTEALRRQVEADLMRK
jgi:shikimate dehydrogenase